MNLKQEEEPRILQEAASLRAQWRRSQVRAMQAFAVAGLYIILSLVTEITFFR